MALHTPRTHFQVLLWKAADKSDPPSVKITDYGWEGREHDHLIPVLSNSHIAPGQLIDVIVQASVMYFVTEPCFVTSIMSFVCFFPNPMIVTVEYFQ